MSVTNKFHLMKEQLFKKLETLSDDMALNDKEYDAQFSIISKQIDQLTNAEYESQAIELHPNTWFQSFLSSFSDCSHKRITLKQANIFIRNLKQIETHSNYNSFHSKTYTVSYTYLGKYNNKVYKLEVFSDCGYLTITEETIITFI